MTSSPPSGSLIEVRSENGVCSIVIPAPQPGVASYGVTAFMMFWLVGWAAAWVKVFHEIMDGKSQPFVLAWFGAWTVGGLWAIYVIFRLLRPTQPERLRLAAQRVSYDSGVRRPDVSPFRQFRWSDLLERRVTIEFDKNDARSLKLRPGEASERLTIDHAAQRLELGRNATDVEREWLYHALRAHFRLVDEAPSA